MKLRDFKGDKGIEVIGRLLIPIINILSNPKNTTAEASKNAITQFSAFFVNNPKDIKEILAIMDDKPVETYEVDGQTALVKLLSWFDDADLLNLFGLQSETQTSSGSATTITEE